MQNVRTIHSSKPEGCSDPIRLHARGYDRLKEDRTMIVGPSLFECDPVISHVLYLTVDYASN